MISASCIPSAPVSLACPTGGAAVAECMTAHPEDCYDDAFREPCSVFRHNDKRRCRTSSALAPLSPS